MLNKKTKYYSKVTNAQFTALHKKAAALKIATLINDKTYHVAGSNWLYTLYFEDEKTKRLADSLINLDGRTLFAFLANSKKRNGKYSVENHAMGGGGVGQIKLIKCRHRYDIRVQISHGVGRYNYADCAVLHIA